MTRCFVVLASLLFLLFSGLPYAPVTSAHGAVSTTADPFTIPGGLKPAVEFWEGDLSRLRLEPARVLRSQEHGRRYTRWSRSSRVPGHGEWSVRCARDSRGAASRRTGSRCSGGSVSVSQPGCGGPGATWRICARSSPPADSRWSWPTCRWSESSFRNDARSFRGAVGMWQFMPSTGRLYMRVTRVLDERRDPLDATRAAARLLQDNYRELGTWPLAVTAYNHGRAGMRRAVRRLGTRDIVTIIRRYRGRTFKFASKNFYAEFLAAVHIMRDLERHLPHLRFDQLVRHEEISLTKRVAVSSLLRHSRVSRAELLTWNPALSRHAAWIPAGLSAEGAGTAESTVPQGVGGHWADGVVPAPRSSAEAIRFPNLQKSTARRRVRSSR